MTSELHSDIREFVTSDGYVHRYRFWPAGHSPPRGYIVALHGIQSHSGWYGYSSSRLAEAGYSVFFLDRRGSGLNEAERGHAPHYERLINDVVQFVHMVRFCRDHEAPAAPVILLSVSWGGKLAAATVSRHADLVDALVLLYPGIVSRVGTTLRQKIRIAYAMLTGKWNQRIPIPLDDPSLFTSNAEQQDFIRHDPLALRDVTVAFCLASLTLSGFAKKLPGRFRCPLLLMLAGKDQIIDNHATRRLFEKPGTNDQKLIEYPQAHHTLEFEKDRDRFINDLLEWLGGLTIDKDNG